MSDKLDLQPGDIACTTLPVSFDPEDKPSLLQSVLSFGIRQAQIFSDPDGQAYYTHSFIILNSNGDTFEALWRYRCQNLYQAYAGRPILIGRFNKLDREAFLATHRKVFKRLEGKRYPALKLPLFLFCPRFIKYLPYRRPVCSELSMYYPYDQGLVSHWRGLTPSYVEDMIRRWRKLSLVYEGDTPIIAKEEISNGCSI